MFVNASSSIFFTVVKFPLIFYADLAILCNFVAKCHLLTFGALRSMCWPLINLDFCSSVVML